MVFLRAANVGGSQVFRPAKVAAALKRLDVVNVGAAGTFVVRSAASPTTIRRELTRQLPFDPVLAIRPAREIVALVARDPFAGVAFSRDLRGWVGVLTAPVRRRPPLPCRLPASGRWSIRFDEIDGAFAMGLWQRDEEGKLIPGSAVERLLGVPMTVRWWETVLKVANILAASAGPSR